ncbi:MAG: hypothetical protein ACLR2O_04385 [Coprococcus sp.]
MSVPTPDEKENTFTGLVEQMARRKRERTPAECGSIPRQRKRSSEESVRQRICQNTTICQLRLISRAKEDYLMGINFSRLLTLKYGNSISNYLENKYTVVSVGRVMTCVLGMVVQAGTGDPGVCKDAVLSCDQNR